MLNTNVDSSHMIHHVLTIIASVIAITRNLGNVHHYKLFSIPYVSFFSSIISALRVIIKEYKPEYHSLVYYIYMFTYLIFKIGSIIFFYLTLFQKKLYIGIDIYMFLSIVLIQITQLYFCFKIIKKILKKIISITSSTFNSLIKKKKEFSTF